MRELFTLVEEGTNVIPFGPQTRGTHLTVALEVEMVRQQIGTYLVTLPKSQFHNPLSDLVCVSFAI